MKIAHMRMRMMRGMTWLPRPFCAVRKVWFGVCGVMTLPGGRSAGSRRPLLDDGLVAIDMAFSLHAIGMHGDDC